MWNFSSFLFIVVIIIIIFAVLWLFCGGRDHDFVGLEPLRPDQLPKGNSKKPDEPVDIPERPDDVVVPLPEPVFEDGSSNKWERACCSVLTKIYGKNFGKGYPAFLRNPETGRQLELDCFRDEVVTTVGSQSFKIAVEYNGIHHYVWPNWTSQTKDQFIKQKRRELFKKDM
jgi:hypothetical protein